MNRKTGEQSVSEKLEKAREYEKNKQKEISFEEKPVFHITPPIGWMNDPNGFSFYDGKIHLFYQYHPYTREWGPMHWGHSVSEDMISWETLPVRWLRMKIMMHLDVFQEALWKQMGNMCFSTLV